LNASFILVGLYDVSSLSVFYFPNLTKTEWWQLSDCGDIGYEVRTAKVAQSTVSLQVGYS